MCTLRVVLSYAGFRGMPSQMPRYTVIGNTSALKYEPDLILKSDIKSMDGNRSQAYALYKCMKMTSHRSNKNIK